MKKINFSVKNYKKNIKKYIKLILNNYKNIFSNSPVLLCFIVTSTLNTLLLRTITVRNPFYFKPLFFDLAFILIISSFSFLFKNKKMQIRYLTFFSIFTTILCVVHSMYYTFYESFASVSLLATSAFVVDVGDAVVKQVLQLHDFAFLWQLFVLFYLLYHLKKSNKVNVIKKVNYSFKNSFLTLIITGIFLFFLFSFFVTPTEWSRFGKMWNRESVVSSFGIFTYQINDIFQSLEPKINNLFGHDKALKMVMDYYENNSIEKTKNKYTDVFKGKNLLVIHAESLQTIALNRKFEGKEVTPFLNKMINESIYFDNFYSTVGVGTSSDAEFTFSTSLMPSNSGTVFVNYFDREYGSIQKQFKNNDYYIFSMHANTGDFWNRATMHDNLGYDKFYSKSSFEIDETIGLGLSDKSFFRQVVPKIKDIMDDKNNVPFYGLLITLTNHTPWSDFKLIDEFPTTWTIDENGKSVVTDYINDTTLGNYFRSVHYADQSLEQLMNDLDNAGILENTVVVIYGDHDARISKKNYNILYNYDPYTKSVKVEGDEGFIDYTSCMYELDRKVPFIIWTKDHKYKEKNSNVMGMIDVSPTLSNMFGVENNPFSLGHDVFSLKDDENTVVFTDGSYVTNKIFYDGQSGDIYSIDDSAVNEEYINSRAAYADTIIDISNDIITYDLIKEMNEKK